MTHGHHHHAHGPAEFDDGELAEQLDLGAEILAGYQTEILDWVGDAATDLSVQRILDLGAGTGTGTVALAQRYPAAEVIALDVSAELLARLDDKAAGLPQVRTVLVEEDADWPELAPVELAWASLSLHHMPDPDRALAQVFTILRPGGLFAVAEMAAPPQFLPDELGDGLGPRLWGEVAGEQADRLPSMGSDWGPRLERAGFTLVDQRNFDFATADSPAIGRYAELFLRRLRGSLADRLSEADRIRLDELLEANSPAAVSNRTDLVVRGRRFGWLARRPA